MAFDIEDSLCSIMRNTEFSLQLDESTLPGNESLLLGYVRFVLDGVVHEELAMALSLNADTRGETVFQEHTVFQELCATDGIPSMIGPYRGFMAFLKAASPDVLTVHCVIHRQHLVAKNMSGSLKISLKTVIKAVNKIKDHALNTRLFKQLCNENDEAFERLLFHNKIRWLFKGNCLARFYSLLDTVVEFLQSCDPGLPKEVIALKNDNAYLLDIFAKFYRTKSILSRQRVQSNQGKVSTIWVQK